MKSGTVKTGTFLYTNSNVSVVETTEGCSKDVFVLFISPSTLVHNFDTRDRESRQMPPWERNGSPSFCRTPHTLTRNFNFRSGRDRGEAFRARRCETRRKTRVIVRWYFSFVNGTPPSLSLRNFVPEGTSRFIATTLHSRIRNYRESKVHWTQLAAQWAAVVNECALVYARAITTCPGGDRCSGWMRRGNLRGGKSPI